MPIWNRPPLAAAAFAVLLPGAVRPRGWLANQLHAAADGLTGRLMEVWPDVGRDSGWLGGSGENWERGPYYVRGLVCLAHTLGDLGLVERARAWIDWSIASQRDDGYFGPAENDDWWPRMPMLDALRWHHEATGDARVLPLMTAYSRYLADRLPTRPLQFWGKPRGGDQLDQLLWLYNRSGDAWLLDLAEVVHRQTSDWVAELGGNGAPDETFDFGHGVNRAMGFKEPAVYSQLSGNPGHRAALRHGWERIMAHHGQVHGLYSGDEFLHGRGSTQGTELCTIVELLASLEAGLAVTGETWIIDAIERIAYNALPAMIAPDFRSRQYFQMPNQVECSPGNRLFHVPHGTDLLFGLETGYGCCTANLHMGWPRLVQHMWLATPEGGLAATLLGPCEVVAEVGAGTTVRISEETAYPFDDEVAFVVHAAAAVEFPLSVHIPGWASTYQAFVNDDPLPCDAAPGAMLRVSRVWKDGDRLTLTLPMRLRTSRWDESLAVERGPLVYALRIGEDWRRVGGHADFPDFEVHPTTPWNYGLCLDVQQPEIGSTVIEAAPSPQPWAQDGAGVQIKVPAKRVPEWVLIDGVSGPVPSAPGATAAAETVTLIPYGCARLRISMFPTC